MTKLLLVSFLALSGCSTGLYSGAPSVDAGPNAADSAFEADLASQCSTMDTAATTLVTLRVRNDAATDRLVAIPTGGGGFNGGWCAGFGVRDAAGAWIPVVEGFQCGCECPMRGDIYADAYRRVMPGETVELATWDGRTLVSCTTQIDCTPDWGPGLGIIEYLRFSSRPLAPGRYHVNVAIERTPPSDCTSSDGVDYECHRLGSGSSYLDRPTEALCPSSETSGADFDLPAAGEIAVVVSVH